MKALALCRVHSAMFLLLGLLSFSFSVANENAEVKAPHDEAAPQSEVGAIS